MYRQRNGFSLIEVLIVLVISVILASAAWPSLKRWWSGVRVELAAGEMAGIFNMAKSYAVRNRMNVGVKFQTQGDGYISYALYRDFDGDGVRTDDIERGVDKVERHPEVMGTFGGVRFGFPADLMTLGKAPRAPGSRRRLSRLEDPIRFNRSDLASFTRHGTATPGTVYLTDGLFYLFAVRVNNRAGKVVVLRYDRKSEQWF